MNKITDLQRDAMEMLVATSRTFFIPISRLSSGLQEAVAAAYLCMRAIDEIEDHTELSPKEKNTLLCSVSDLLQKSFNENDFNELFHPYESIIPEVSLRLYDWIKLCPPEVAPKILEATAIMSKGMAKWVVKDWQVKNIEDLDEYTYYVAGLVGVMLSDLWKWYDGTETDKKLAIAFGRGLQSVNILRNRNEDMERGVDFFPDGWSVDDMFTYARENLELADQYLTDIERGEIFEFCKIPLALAQGTLDTLEKGKEKLSRSDVAQIVNQVVEQ